MCDPPPIIVLFCACTSSNVNVNNIEEERVNITFYSSFIEFIGKAGTN